jgi:hypothetical protein
VASLTAVLRSSRVSAAFDSWRRDDLMEKGLMMLGALVVAAALAVAGYAYFSA